MKIINLFKKENTKKVVKSTVLSKDQLDKVVGGLDTIDATTTTTEVDYKKHVAGVKYEN